MALRIRQIALVARALAPVERELWAALDVEVCYRDPGVEAFGLHNALFALGDTFLEVVSPIREGTTAGRLLDRRGGDGGYMVIFETDRLAEDRKRFVELGIREVWSIELRDIAAVHLHPKDVGGAIMSFDQPLPAGSWRWAGPDWQRLANRSLSIVGAELQCEDPLALSAQWARVLDRPARALFGGAHAIDLDGGQLTFVNATDGRGEGISTVTMRAPEGTERELAICGVRLELANAGL